MCKIPGGEFPFVHIYVQHILYPHSPRRGHFAL